jgi:opacity protein-like surface antigen
MLRKVMLVSALAFLVFAQTASAREHKIEITPTFGWTFSEGVNVNDRTIDLDGGIVIKGVDPESGMSYGFAIDVALPYQGMIGFLWNRQDSKFVADKRAGGTRDLTDMNVDNYHGVLTYVNRDLHPKAAPYVFGGLGATHYTFSTFLGEEIDGETQFSTTWGLGVRVYATEKVGVKFQGRWTPTYIKSDTAGIWCDPFSCWVLGDNDYSNQFELSGSLMFLF